MEDIEVRLLTNEDSEELNNQIKDLQNEKEDLEKLTARMQELQMDMEGYEPYLDLRRFGTTRHAGFGLGFERCVMYMTGVSNIRDVLPFPRTVNNCEL